ncbi:Uncharacterised protein [Vibrio cholerae]|nr:Uncharacterised protein [Vibrio cholerae]
MKSRADLFKSSDTHQYGKGLSNEPFLFNDPSHVSF